MWNRVGSFAWKAQWGPDYHQSMYIGIGALVISSALAFGQYLESASWALLTLPIRVYSYPLDPDPG